MFSENPRVPSLTIQRTHGKSACARARFSGEKRKATTRVSQGAPVWARIPARQGYRLSNRFMHTMTILTSGASIPQIYYFLRVLGYKTAGLSPSLYMGVMSKLLTLIIN